MALLSGKRPATTRETLSAWRGRSRRDQWDAEFSNDPRNGMRLRSRFSSKVTRSRANFQRLATFVKRCNFYLPVCAIASIVVGKIADRVLPPDRTRNFGPDDRKRV